MKKILLPLITLALFTAACNRSEQAETSPRNIQLLRDSTVYTNNNMYTDTLAGVQAAAPAIEEARQQRSKPPKKRISIPEKNEIPEIVYQPQTESKPVVTPPVSPETTQGPAENGSTDETTTTDIPQVEKKKGWDNATKGAVIGGAAGAIGGVILSKKKKGLGAVIGGVVGAATGYTIGRDMDKKKKN